MTYNLMQLHPTPFAFAFNSSCFFLPTGVINTQIPNTIYPWADEDQLYLNDGRPLTAEETLLLNRIHAYAKLLNWQYFGRTTAKI